MDVISQALEAVQFELPKVKYRLMEPMKFHTSFGIGGPVRVMFFPEKPTALTDLCKVLYESGATPLVIGNGTNLLVSDEALEIAVVNTSMMNSRERTGETGITASAGVLTSRLAIFASECGLAGLEFVHGIPGSLGGAVFMNAGAYGREMKDVIQSTTVYRPNSGVITLKGDEHGYSYRRSRFAESGEIIVSSVLKLEAGETEAIRAKIAELNARRRESQPIDMPSAGCAFKHPSVGFAGSLIEQAGLRGYLHGAAQVSEKHAGFIVNRGGATFSDVMAVIEHVKETVYKQFGVEFDLEIKIIK